MATVKSTQVTNAEATPQSLNDYMNNRMTLYGSYTTTSTNTTSDVIQMVEIPKGYVVTGGYVKWEAFGGTGLTFDFGITGVDVDCYLDGKDATAATGAFIGAGGEAGAGPQATNDTLDILLIDAGSSTVTAGKTIEVWVEVAQVISDA